jgi:hypothetical protein
MGLSVLAKLLRSKLDAKGRNNDDERWKRYSFFNPDNPLAKTTSYRRKPVSRSLAKYRASGTTLWFFLLCSMYIMTGFRLSPE